MLPLAQVQPPPFEFNAMTWAAFLLANAIVLAITGPPLLRELRAGRARKAAAAQPDKSESSTT